MCACFFLFCFFYFGYWTAAFTHKANKEVKKSEKDIEKLNEKARKCVCDFSMVLLTVCVFVAYCIGSIIAIDQHFGNSMSLINTVVLFALEVSYMYGYNRNLRDNWWIIQRIVHFISFCVLTYLTTRTTSYELSLADSIVVYVLHYMVVLVIALLIGLEACRFKNFIMCLWPNCCK